MKKSQRISWYLCLAFLFMIVVGIFLPHLDPAYLADCSLCAPGSWHFVGNITKGIGAIGALFSFSVAMLIGKDFTTKNGRLRLLETVGIPFFIILGLDMVNKIQSFRSTDYFTPGTTVYDVTLLKLGYYALPLTIAITPVIIAGLIISAIKKHSQNINHQ